MVFSPGDKVYLAVDPTVERTVLVCCSVNDGVGSLKEYVGVLKLSSIHTKLYYSTWEMNKAYIDMFRAGTTSGGGSYLLISNIDSYLGSKCVWMQSQHFMMKTSSKHTAPSIPINSNLDGACCKNCGTFAYMANENFICFSCKEDPYRCSVLNCNDDE